MRVISLEKVFEEFCDKHEHLKLLLSQWRFDKELISKALQNINTIFPHYSRHDASHSRQIIVNIERMLGERIYNLTATDIWLILESAYCHDIGMVVTHKQMQDLDTPEFLSYLGDVAAQPEHELSGFAAKWIKGDATLPLGTNSQEFMEQHKQLLAEWYRKKHPQNAAKIIRNPFDEIGLSSPRNELLPKRLFGALAAICDAHGSPFSEVMRLPFSEAGMATEDCHPRYVAFLLRMADLLDIDDNRFCPVMVKMCGAKLPGISHAHFEKHQGIKNFRLDSERIKIEVECPSPESYEVAHEWFTWLEKEYHSQSQHWPKIVPNKKLGRLPILSPPKVTLRAPYLIINEGKTPNFDLDQTAIFKLLRGTGLYTSKVDSIREILQNAVDSSIIAIWTQSKDKILKLNPGSLELISLYDEKAIVVDFNVSSDDTERFTLTVKDSGMGISWDDLKRMLTVGNSTKTSERSRVIRAMPKWFRPSGNFGIGLQSISLLSDRFTIITKSRSSDQAYKLQFNLGLGSSVVIESIDSHSVDYGATVSVDLTIDGFPSAMNIPWGRERSVLLDNLSNYDFTEPGSDLKGYEQLQIFSAIKEFNAGSPIKISSAQHALDMSRYEVFFDSERNICLSYVKFGSGHSSENRTFFRGQAFSGLNLYTPFLSCIIDFYGFEAMEFLTYNREKILPHVKSEAAKIVNKALLNYIEVNISELEASQRPYAAAYYYMRSDRGVDITPYLKDLGDYEVHIEGLEPIKMDELLKKIKTGSLVNFQVRSASDITAFNGRDGLAQSNLAVLSAGSPESTLSLIKLLATRDGLFWQEQEGEEPHNHTCSFSVEDKIPLSKEIMLKALKGKRDNLTIGRRMIFPAWGRYRRLAVSAEIKWARHISHESERAEQLVLPYILAQDSSYTVDISDNLVGWVYKNRVGKDVTAEEIKKLYAHLVEEIRAFVN
ncbi:ATP-binding protein [Pseudomonas viridiflava]|uniref:HD domain-containing protein n=1 Tax=Pseudomonas viridiflava TaxID=33069 RepID=UPI0015E2BA88|nr:ATP-binding protein [Pseudomonas viridiflava]MBA1232656.1 ATP-binding protein [Pseudomonas viridiflava]